MLTTGPIYLIAFLAALIFNSVFLVLAVAVLRVSNRSIKNAILSTFFTNVILFVLIPIESKVLGYESEYAIPIIIFIIGTLLIRYFYHCSIIKASLAYVISVATMFVLYIVFDFEKYFV